MEKLDWEEIILNVGKPVWDSKENKWRVLEGYKKILDKSCIKYTDSINWYDFKSSKLYLKER